ncbi:gamma-glutamyltransferase [Bacillus sp. A116_S68]|nr:gamma-glutamyltransferase [Bacillus sp. A116_S68]
MNYKRYLNVTYVFASVIFIGLISWYFYFESEFDPFREPYSDSSFTNRQVESLMTSENNSQTAEQNNGEARVDIYGTSSAHPLAAEVGMDIIENGGTAIDAAVAVSFMLNVVEPYGSGIGGGGVMLYHDPAEGVISYDYREAAPISGNDDPTGRGVAIPGFVKGMDLIHDNHGELPWEDVIAPAIEQAETGFQVGDIFHQQTGNAVRYLEMEEHERQLFFPEGQALGVNDLLVQEDLADTLRLIQENRSDGFYSGPIGDLLQQQFNFTEEDLASYEPQITEPVSAEVGEQIVYGGPSPSSGTVVVQALQVADQLDLNDVFPDEDLPEDFSFGDLANSEDSQHIYIHLINEITKVTYDSRLDTLGDPAFDDIDHQALTGDDYIQQLLDEISFNEITPGDTSELFDSPAEEADSRHTTHFVIVDKEGRMVSATHSLGEFFGSGIYIDGFFINNQMTNFSDNPDSINRYEPGKRPRTFVAPMIFEEEGQPVLGMGSPGGRRIPAMVFQTIMQYHYGINDDGDPMTLQEAIEAPRFYNEEDVIYLQEELPEDVSNELRNMGYSVVGHSSPLFYGGIQGLGVVIDDNGNVEGMYGGGDPRRNGAWQIESE